MGGGRVLIVDDDPDIRDLLESILVDVDCEVKLAENGRAGLNVLSHWRPDGILLDLMMPVMTGWEMLDILRVDDRWGSTPVVIMSAASNLSQRPAGEISQDTLAKPFSMDRLLEKVEQWTAVGSGSRSAG